MLRVTGKRECQLCKKLITTQHVGRHVRDVHTNAEKSKCQYCQRWMRISSLPGHIERLHSSQSLYHSPAEMNCCEESEARMGSSKAAENTKRPQKNLFQGDLGKECGSSTSAGPFIELTHSIKKEHEDPYEAAPCGTWPDWRKLKTQPSHISENHPGSSHLKDNLQVENEHPDTCGVVDSSSLDQPKHIKDLSDLEERLERGDSSNHITRSLAAISSLGTALDTLLVHRINSGVTSYWPVSNMSASFSEYGAPELVPARFCWRGLDTIKPLPNLIPSEEEVFKLCFANAKNIKDASKTAAVARALTQLWRPNASKPLTVSNLSPFGLRSTMQIPDGLKQRHAFGSYEYVEGRCTFDIAPRHSFIDVSYGHSSGIFATIGNCAKVWFLWPLTQRNLAQMDGLRQEEAGKRFSVQELTNGVIAYATAGEALVLPTGWICASLAVEGGFLFSFRSAPPRDVLGGTACHPSGAPKCSLEDSRE